jgi:hypothetical protein
MHGHASMIVGPASLDQNRQCGLVHAASYILVAAAEFHVQALC